MRQKDGKITLEIITELTLQTKQALSQVQMESLNILSMPAEELKSFLQNEEIENPLVELSAGGQRGELPVIWREYDRFYNGGSRDDRQEEKEAWLYAADSADAAAGAKESVEELLYAQLPLKELSADEVRIVDFAVQSLEGNGYLHLTAREIGEALRLSEILVETVLDKLKCLEPRGIFASGLMECLLLQIEGKEEAAVLKTIITEHLQDVAEGKISNISRALKLPSMEVRKLIQIIKNLNPRPLNGFGGERAQYIVPDILLSFQDGQWTVSLNEKGTGTVGINEFYVHMMETAGDEELKAYFEEKLKRARFIMSAVEQRKKTLEGITEGILRRQAGFLSGKAPLRPMTLEEIAGELGIHKSTVSRAIREKYLLAPAGCLLLRDLFTAGIASGDGPGENISRNTVKARIRELVASEDKKKPCSDEQLANLLLKEGMAISRRTVAKYRMELGIGSTFLRKEA